MLNLQQALNVALEAAAAGAAELISGYGIKLEIKHKGATDLVTEYDLRSEKIIRSIISRAYPEHQVAGEEGGRSGAGQSPYIWYIDPLDGTTNFAHAHPFFAVSIGLFGPDGQGRQRPLAGVI